jgi:hypothetical protein
MFAVSVNLAVALSECQRDWTAHKPKLSGEQALVAEKLALEYHGCQFC